MGTMTLIIYITDVATGTMTRMLEIVTVMMVTNGFGDDGSNGYGYDG